ncbi:prolipoprotein diacylglyceryl transferase [Parasphaerochaeta coccoides]|uniref:Phosphatidylglycerol--prolipoprotein diacylglyceryl transferase n=1 Tax=Parasphaerochaeta coccoides (strain ATCC BAA-1237 / DSM 17374 / SPN1) TaxID=760011 RepID=F4GLZ1_PARC1|nr:prolipoprotein diacylglyceryl transferase [Parasphaerochaeta coccoides]AEC03032.1 Prolipoprotein diacylglyceryl transferase [Parasphaerochaeta coccoides DSM 17374]
MVAYIHFPSWIHPEIIPGLPVRWYALMYLVAFAVTYLLFTWQVRRGGLAITTTQTQDLFLFAITGLILGARVFSVLFYNDEWLMYLTRPWLIFWPWQNGVFVGLPGMSYHGGVVGAVIGGVIACRRHRLGFFRVADTIVAGIPLGYAFGRLGNFINGELWGRVTTQSWGIVFPHAPGLSTRLSWVRDVADIVGMEYARGDLINLPRHPSQLYEAFGEGILLWLVLWFILRPRRGSSKNGFLLSAYLIGYGIIRFVIEYFREPDAGIGYVIAAAESPTALFASFGNISLGQIFCLLMIIGGILLYILLPKKTSQDAVPADAKKRQKETTRSHHGKHRH